MSYFAMQDWFRRISKLRNNLLKVFFSSIMDDFLSDNKSYIYLGSLSYVKEKWHGTGIEIHMHVCTRLAGVQYNSSKSHVTVLWAGRLRIFVWCLVVWTVQQAFITQLLSIGMGDVGLFHCPDRQTSYKNPYTANLQ